jgi:hypothetical protein
VTTVGEGEDELRIERVLLKAVFGELEIPLDLGPEEAAGVRGGGDPKPWVDLLGDAGPARAR